MLGVNPTFFLVIRGNSTLFYYHKQVSYPHIHTIHKERKSTKKKEMTTTTSFPPPLKHPTKSYTNTGLGVIAEPSPNCSNCVRHNGFPEMTQEYGETITVIANPGLSGEAKHNKYLAKTEGVTRSLSKLINKKRENW